MSIIFECPHCNAKVHAPENSAGRTGKCFNCAQRIIVPAAPSPSGNPPLPPIYRAKARLETLAERKAPENRRNMIVCIAFVAAVLAMAGFLWRKVTRNIGRDSDAVAILRNSARYYPASVSSLKGIDGVGAILRKLKPLRELHTIAGSFGKQIGVMKEFEGSGIDPDAVIEVAVADTENPEWSRHVFTCRDTVDGKAGTHVPCHITRGGRLYYSMLVRESGQDGSSLHKDDSVESLRAFLDSAEQDSLASDPGFQSAVAQLPGGQDLAIFLHNTRRTRRAANPLNCAAMSIGPGEQTYLFTIAAGNQWIDSVVPGGSCSVFIRQLDKPIAIVTVSLKDPVTLLHAMLDGVAKTVPGWTTSEADIQKAEERADANCQQELGCSLAEFKALFADLTAGAALYPAEDGSINAKLRYLVFLKVNRERFLEIAGRLGKARPDRPAYMERRDFGKNIVVMNHKEGAAMALIGDYLVFGNSMAQVERLAKGKASGWEPAIGGGDLFSMEVLAGPLMKKYFETANRNVDSKVQSRLNEDLPVTLKSQRKANTFILKLEYGDLVDILPDAPW